MAIFNIFKSNNYSEADIINALQSGDEAKIGAMANWLEVQFIPVWKKCIQRDWDADLAWKASENAIVAFIGKVQKNKYTAGNWIGFCRVAATSNYRKMKKSQKVFRDIEAIPESIGENDLDDYAPLLSLYGEIEWEHGLERSEWWLQGELDLPTANRRISIQIAQWHVDGFSWKEICEKLKTVFDMELGEAALRKQWERANFSIRVLLIKQQWENKAAYFQFCRAFCRQFVGLRLQKTRIRTLKNDYPEIVEAILENTGKTDLSEAADTQFEKCITCITSKIAR